MAHTPVSNVDPDDFGKATWADEVRAADLDLTARTAALESVITGATGTGDVSAAAVIADNKIVRGDGGAKGVQDSGIAIADGASGTLAGSNSGDVTLDGPPNYLSIIGQVITRALIDLTAHVTGRLPFGNLVQVTAGRLLGRASASGLGDAQELSLGVGLAWNGTAIDCTVVPSTPVLTGSRVLSGGEIVWVSAYTFNVSAATYLINGTQYQSAEQTVSLAAAHATLDRIDVIAADDTGTILALTGTAAAQPSEPDIDSSTQLKLGIVFVAHATSAPPTVTTEALYAENTGGPGEWNWTTSGTGFNVNSSTNPHGGTKTIEGTSVAAGAYALAAKPSGTLDITTYGLLVFYIRSKNTWNNSRSLQIQFRNAGVLVGSPVTFKHNTYGFDASNLTTYQQIAIPITAFAIPAATVVNQLRLLDAGGSIGFYIDDVSLQTGGSTNVTGGITQDQADARYAQRANNLSDLSSASSARGNLSAAPKTPSFVTLGTDSELTNERVLTAGSGISLTDAGAGSTLTIAATGSGAPANAQYVTLATDATLTNERVLAAGSGISLTDAGAGSTITIAATGGGATSADLRSVFYPPFSVSGDDDEFDDSTFSGWTAVNSGSHNPTITETNDRASFLCPGGDSGGELHAYMKSRTIITNDWIECAFTASGKQQNYNMFGLIFADGTTYGAGAQVVFMHDPSENQWMMGSFTNYSSFSNIGGFTLQYGAPNHLLFMRYKYLGSNNWVGYTSPDGISWANVTGTISRTLTPTKVGFFMSTWSGSAPYVWSMNYVRFGNG